MTVDELKERVFLGFPLVKYVFEQSTIKLVMRPIDMTWHYKGVVPISVSGFNPLGNKIFFGKNSYVDKFLNFGNLTVEKDEIDWYLYEIFFVVHDYVHIWAVTNLLVLFPECLEPDALRNHEVINNISYILLMSEVAATIAVDFWMLSSVDVSKKLQLETKFRCLTTSFKISDLANAKILNPQFEVKSLQFFQWLAIAYFESVFEGFDCFDADNLEKYAPWLMKEKKISIVQRQLIVKWLSYLGDLEEGNTQQVVIGMNNHRKISAMEEIASKLWAVFGRSSPPKKLRVNAGKYIDLPKKATVFDFRFLDILNVDLDLLSYDAQALTMQEFGYLAAQYISLFDWSEEWGLTADMFDDIVRKKDLYSLLFLFGFSKSCSVGDNGTVHLFIPN